ncbi:MAG: M48 family metalloprotease [Candidatus Omnitrophica bacterium]|nr:M48 family metalloprotease [Candidatus Omnitrophota bacterium]
MKHKLPILLLMIAFVTALVSGCATTGPRVSPEEIKRKQEEFNAKFFEAAQGYLPRVYRVGYQLITHHVPDHGDEKPKYGFVGVGVDELKDYSRKAYQIDKSVKGVLVLGLYPGSKAAGGDIQPGDVIQKINGSDTKDLKAYFGKIKGVTGDFVQAKIWRKGSLIERDIPVEKVFYNCHFFLGPTPNFDAQSLFSRIDVGIGAIRYCRNDDELAFLMGHELAHTTRHHGYKKLGAGLASAIAYGALAGTIDTFTVPGVGNAVTTPMQQATDNAVSREYEREADYFGMKHTFHSGYSVKNGYKIFSRLATDKPGFDVLKIIGSTHPNAPERLLRLEKTLEEFKQQFPEKYEKQENNADWEVVISVQPGETIEVAVEKMIEEKKLAIKQKEEKTELDKNQYRLESVSAVFWNAFESARQPEQLTDEKVVITQAWQVLEIKQQKADEFKVLNPDTLTGSAVDMPKNDQAQNENIAKPAESASKMAA